MFGCVFVLLVVPPDCNFFLFCRNVLRVIERTKRIVLTMTG